MNKLHEKLRGNPQKFKVVWYSLLQKKRIFLLLLIPVSFLLLALASSNIEIAEHVFARGIYKWSSQIISNITGLLPFSFMEISIILIPPLALFLFFRFIYLLVQNIRRKDNLFFTILMNGILNLLCALSVVLFLFVFLGGINYYRYSFSAYSGLSVRESTVEELYDMTLNLTQDAYRIREKLELQGVHETEEGVLFINETGWKDIGIRVNQAFSKISETYPVLGGHYSPPKTVFFSKFMSRMEITGIFWPFTMEANVNVDMPEYSVPATMAHEIAHQRGFMREDEANFIAYLVCKESEDLRIQYSGIMLALSYASNQLYKHDPSLYYLLREEYHGGMVADLREEYYYWKQFEDTVISTVSNTMNDTYLKVNNQNDGVKSYGRMVDLLLAEYRKEEGLK